MSDRTRIWWRDDDAVTLTPALSQLLALKRKWALPLALAVVPAKAEPPLAAAIEGEDIDILAHGYAHQNHAGKAGRKAEFTAARSVDDMRGEMRSGLATLQSRFPNTLPVFVPPWNRMPPALVADLPDCGFSGLSAWGEASSWPSVPGVQIANAHVDIIDWRAGGGAKRLGDLWANLEVAVKMEDPVGILTHHLQMSADAFSVLDTFFAIVSQNPAFEWTRARHIFQTAK